MPDAAFRRKALLLTGKTGITELAGFFASSTLYNRIMVSDHSPTIRGRREMLVLKNTIKECRVEKHINQQQMADDFGVTRETLGKLERGQLQNPYYRLVYGVAAYFGKSVDDVFVFEDE